jgi:ABC-type branched-subunit amino acid transport system permease subunit
VVILLCGGIAILLAIGFAVSGALEIAGINPVFSLALGFLLSGLLGAIAGWIVMQQASVILTPSNLTPSRTITVLRRAASRVGEKLHLHPRDDHEQNPPSP